jgi:hypothetical protein
MIKVIAIVCILLLVVSPLAIALIIGSDILAALPWSLILAVVGVVLIVWLFRGRKRA